MIIFSNLFTCKRIGAFVFAHLITTVATPTIRLELRAFSAKIITDFQVLLANFLQVQKDVALTRCLEVFHNEFFLERNQVAPIMKNIEFRKFNTSKVSLSHRFYDLGKSVADIILDRNFSLLFGFIIGKDSIQKLSDTRNYYTHFSENKRFNAWKVGELGSINIALMIFIRVLFFKQAGFDFDISRMLVSKWKNRYLQ
ncbi:MAG TPA: HEPN domain-containing protein [Puia sp.]|nr:HEPN domain-containing protein [Puia sp.]